MHTIRFLVTGAVVPAPVGLEVDLFPLCNLSTLADWMRVIRDIKACSGQCTTWFKGRDPSLTPSAFQLRWGLGEVLVKVGIAPGGHLSMTVKLSTDTVAH